MPEALTDGGPPVPLIPPPAPKDAHFLRLRLPAKISHKREPAGGLTTRGASNPDNVWACHNRKDRTETQTRASTKGTDWVFREMLPPTPVTISRLKIPTDRPLCVTPAGNREQHNADSTSASRQGVATGPIYGLGSAAVLAPTRTPPGPSTPRIRVGGTVRSERSPCLYSVWFDGCRTLSRPVSHAA